MMRADRPVSDLAAKAKDWRSWASFVAVLCVFGVGILAGHLAVTNDSVRGIVAAYGYAGIFVIALVSGFNLAVPIPAIAFLPAFLGAGLDVRLTVAVISVGVTVADCMAFMIGKTGRSLVPLRFRKTLARMERIRHRYHAAPLGAMFLWSMLAPLPNEVLAIPLGLMGYRLWQIAPILLLGNIVFNSLSAIGIAAFFDLVV